MSGSSCVARALWLLPLLVLQVGCDQGTKVLAETHLEGRPPLLYFGGAFKLVYAENPGAFLGWGGALGDELRFALFVVAVGIGLVGGLLWILTDRRITRFGLVAGSALLAGGLGNLIDRWSNGGRVADFMQLSVGSLKTGIFNVADLQILLGCLAFVVLSHRPGSTKKSGSGVGLRVPR